MSFMTISALEMPNLESPACRHTLQLKQWVWMSSPGNKYNVARRDSNIMSTINEWQSRWGKARHWRRLRKEARTSNDLEQGKWSCRKIMQKELSTVPNKEKPLSKTLAGHWWLLQGSCNKHWRQKLDSGVRVEAAGIDFSFSDTWFGRWGNRLSIREAGYGEDSLGMAKAWVSGLVGKCQWRGDRRGEEKWGRELGREKQMMPVLRWKLGDIIRWNDQLWKSNKSLGKKTSLANYLIWCSYILKIVQPVQLGFWGQSHGDLCRSQSIEIVIFFKQWNFLSKSPRKSLPPPTTTPF